MTDSSMDRVPQLMSDLFSIVAELEDMFRGRRFTLDGHLVGSIGEVWAEHLYDLVLDKASTKTHDGTAPDGRRVQVKATQITSVAISSEPEHLIVLRLQGQGEPEEIYNGPGSGPWTAAGKRQKNGQCRISLSKLRELQADVTEDQTIPRRV